MVLCSSVSNIQTRDIGDSTVATESIETKSFSSLNRVSCRPGTLFLLPWAPPSQHLLLKPPNTTTMEDNNNNTSKLFPGKPRISMQPQIIV